MVMWVGTTQLKHFFANYEGRLRVPGPTRPPTLSHSLQKSLFFIVFVGTLTTFCWFLLVLLDALKLFLQRKFKTLSKTSKNHLIALRYLTDRKNLQPI